MKRIITLFLSLIIATTSLFARPIDTKTAQQAANSFLRSITGVQTDIHPIGFPDEVSFQHIFIFGNSHCFVIIAADNASHPILGYSTSSAFGITDIPENILGWLQDYDRQIAQIADSKLEATQEIQSEWDRLLNGQGLVPKSRTSVSPLVYTHWDQRAPYNNLCPADEEGPNGHVYAGCGATAMAQLMNYWEHPVKGVGSHSYLHSTYGNQSANFGSTTYAWDDMRNVYSHGYNATEASAVATLVYHCGVAIDMDYGVNGSSSYASDVATALHTYFKYSTDTHYEQKTYSYNGNVYVVYPDDEWITMLKNELDLDRPLLYRGSGDGGGHLFICDGYDENNYFHFNWGWSGSCDGYYVIGALNPGPGGSGSGSSGNYSSFNGAIFGCAPNTPSINPPTNPSASVNGRNVTLSWNSASSATHYKVYRDNDMIAGNVTETSFTDNNVTYGSHNYYLKSVKYDGTMSLRSTVATAEVTFPGPVPTNLQATANNNSVNLSWTAPTSQTTILQYGTGSMTNSMGYNNSGIYWGQRYPSSTLSEYAGMAINKVSVYFRYSGTYDLYIYKGNECTGTDLVYQRSYTASSGSWQDITVSTPFEVDYTKDLWVVLYAPESISYPAAFCSYTGSGTENSCLYSRHGDNWYIWGDNQYSFMIKTYMTDGTHTYKLYRNGSVVANNLTSASYTDNNLPQGSYDYYVTTNYYGGESAASNHASVVIGTPSYSITVTANPTNGGSVTGGGNFETGQSCTVAASANTGYNFTNWTENGSVVSSEASYTFTVTGSRNLVANFTPLSYSITATADPADGGTITGGGTYNYGQTCTLTANPNTGYTFVNWTRNGTEVSTNESYSFIVTEPASFVAHFSIQAFTVTVAANPDTGGSVSGGGTFNYGASCTVHAVPNIGYDFINWKENGSVVSSSPDYTFTVTCNRNLEAMFALQSFDIIAIADPENGGIITGAGTYHYGETVNLHITPNENYFFENWTENGIPVSDEETLTFIVNCSRSFVATLSFVDEIYESGHAIMVYPNPANDVLTIQGEGILSIRIINALGQLEETIHTNGQERTLIDVSQYDQSIYLIEIQTINGITTKRFVKK